MRPSHNIVLIRGLSTWGTYKTRKVVVFFDSSFCPQTINAGINDIMMRHGHSLAKSHHRINRFGNWIKTSIKFGAALFRDILGISPDNTEVIDFRNRFDSYKSNGGRRL